MRLIARIPLPPTTRQPDSVYAMVHRLYTRMHALREHYSAAASQQDRMTEDMTHSLLELAFLEGTLMGINWVLGGNTHLDRQYTIEREIITKCDPNVMGYS